MASKPALRVYGCILPVVQAPVVDVVAPLVAPPGQGGGDPVQAQPVHRFLDDGVFYVLHFFSGQRKPGDFQHRLDQALAARPYPVWVLSLDFAIGAKLRDLPGKATVTRWLDMAKAGRVVLVLGGPLCETCSAACWNGGSRVPDGAPRAVRSRSALWGLQDFVAREREQVALGNALLRTVVLFLAAARAYGFAAIMEHPQCPDWVAGAPSAWLLPELRCLAAAGGLLQRPPGPVLLWHSLVQAHEAPCLRYPRT